MKENLRRKFGTQSKKEEQQVNGKYLGKYSLFFSSSTFKNMDDC